MSAALRTLQGTAGRRFSVRAYAIFDDGVDPTAEQPIATPTDAADLTGDGRQLDLVASFQSRSGDVEGYCRFVRSLVTQYGSVMRTLQVTEEPNVTGNPVLDGDYPRVDEALVCGVMAAAEGVTGPERPLVGFNTTPLFGPAASFPSELVRLGGPPFVAALDYVGLDFFPDVFVPVEPAELGRSVSWLLEHHRRRVLEPAGLGEMPLHITENGWPTGPERTVERQAEVLDTVVRSISGCEETLGVEAYCHFSLRDADSGRDTVFHRFGLMTDDYRPKPAFETYRRLVSELG